MNNRARELTEETPVHTNIKTVVAVAVAVAAGVWAWASLKAEVSLHTKQLDAIQFVQNADHDLLTEINGVLKARVTAPVNSTATSTPTAVVSTARP